MKSTKSVCFKHHQFSSSNKVFQKKKQKKTQNSNNFQIKYENKIKSGIENIKLDVIEVNANRITKGQIRKQLRKSISNQNITNAMLVFLPSAMFF